MFDIARLMGRRVSRPDGPAVIAGAAVLTTYWQVGEHHPRGQELHLVLIRKCGRLAVEPAGGCQLLPEPPAGEPDGPLPGHEPDTGEPVA